MPDANDFVFAVAHEHPESLALQPPLRAPEVEELARSLARDPERRVIEAVEREAGEGSDLSRQVTDLSLELLLRGVDGTVRPGPELEKVLRHVIEVRRGEPEEVAEKSVGGVVSAQLTVFASKGLVGAQAHLEATPSAPGLGGAAHPSRALLPARSARLGASALHHDALAAVFEGGGWTGRFVRARVGRGGAVDLPDLAAHGLAVGPSAFVAQAGGQPFAFDFADFLQDIDALLGGVLDDASRSAGFPIGLRDRIRTPFGVCEAPIVERAPCLRICVPLEIKSQLGDVTTDINLYIGAGLRHGRPALDIVRLTAFVPPGLFQPMIQSFLGTLLAPGGAAWSSAQAVIQQVAAPLAAFRNLQLCTIAPLLVGTRATGPTGHSDHGAQLLMAP